MKGNVMKEKKSKLSYETPELTVTKVKMESVFLAESMMTGDSRIQANIKPFEEDTPPDNNGDITLNL
jgi:hypothetical protein